MLITLGVILVLLIVTPMLFKSKIEAVVKEKVNDEIHATVDWTRFGLSLFRGFPNLSVSLHQVSVVGVEPFDGDTLAGLNRFELRVNPFSVLKKNLVVNSILVERPLINGIVLEDGTANWDITDAAPVEEDVEETDAGGGSSMTVSLKRFAITDGRINYKDKSADIDAALEGFNLELAGDLSMEETELQLSAGIDRLNAKMGGIRYMRDGVFHLDLLAAANMVEQRYTLKENMISLNGLALGVEGEVLMLEEGAMDMDLKFFSRETSFQTLLSLVPAIYLKDFETLKTSGNLQLEGEVSGIMKDSLLPDATLNLQVTDGYFAYPDLPKDVSDVQISMQVNYKGADMDETTVNLDRFHLLLGGNPFDLSLKVDHPISDMHVLGVAKGQIDFATLKDVLPLEDMSLDGSLETDLRWDTRMSYIEKEQYEKVDLEGKLLIEDMVVESPDIPVPVELTKMHMDFNPRLVDLVTLDLILGSSDLHLDGELSNFIPFVFNDQTISGKLNLTSQLLDANELLPETTADMELPEAESDSIVPAAPDSLAQPALVRIPENIDFAMILDMKKILYEKILVENLKGEMRVMDGTAGLDHLTMNVVEGEVTTSGWVDTRGEFTEVDLDLDVKGVDIPTAYSTFVSIEKLAPMAKFCKGSVNVGMKLNSLLDASFSPLYESINARGKAITKSLQVVNLDSYVQMSKIAKSEKFNNLMIDDMKVSFTVRDGRIKLSPFMMRFEDSRMKVSGTHGIDLSMDYLMDMTIAKSDLGEGANEMMKGMTLLAATAGLKIPESDYVKVKAKITGTFNSPKVATDLSGNMKSAGETVKAAVEEKVTKEVEKVKKEVKQEVEKVREESSGKADKIIADAEEEAARLVEEARKKGEELVKEAEKQGEKLVEDAGSNPIKQIAAKTAASELIRQAEKQSAKLVSEAELKSAKIIQEARDKADKI